MHIRHMYSYIIGSFSDVYTDHGAIERNPTPPRPHTSPTDHTPSWIYVDSAVGGRHNVWLAHPVAR